MPDQRKLLLALGIVCFAFVGGAVTLQMIMDLLPCPLCIIQRYAFLGAGFACVLGAAFKRPRAGLAIAGLATLGGLGTAAKHIWVLAHPGFSCGIDPAETFLNRLPMADWWPEVFQANGLCENATDSLLGLNIPQWAALAFVLTGAAIVFVWRRGRH